MNRLLINILLTVITHLCANAQLAKYMETNFKGGVSFDAFTDIYVDWQIRDTIKFKNLVPSGSSIKKALLFYNRINHIGGGPNPVYDQKLYCEFNGNKISLDSSDIFGVTVKCSTNLNAGKMNYGIKDISSICQHTNNTLIINPTQNFNYGPPLNYIYGWITYGLVILYENNNTQNTNFVLWVNQNDLTNYYNISINNVNPINNIYDVGLSLYNTNNLLTWASTYTLSSTAGQFDLNKNFGMHPNRMNTIAGSFDYENGILTGISDDIADIKFDTCDGLANIKTMINNNSTNFNLSGYTSTSIGGDNIRVAILNAYTTPCPARDLDQDSTRILEMCIGDSVQLVTDAGTLFNWYPGKYLSDSLIQNPFCKPPITTNYVVDIDSAGCHHTLNYKVKVYQKPAVLNVQLQNPICGGNGGSINYSAPHSWNTPIQYSINGQSAGLSNVNLSPGTYTLQTIDSKGCKWEQLYALNEINLANANIAAQPQSGVYPLNVNFYNGSTNTNTNIWYNGIDTALTQNYNYTFQQPGTYTVTLISYYNQNHCADTAYAIINVEDSLHWFMPNVFTPNNDKLNDVFFINPHYYEQINWQIYDRWGLLLKQGNEKIKGSNNSYIELWDGKTNSGEAPSGIYYYTIELKHPDKEAKILKGFVSLMR